MNAEPKIIAHLVHGTWPTGGFLPHKYPRLFKPSPVWTENDSEFCHALKSKLPGIEFRPFKWSGENREADRRKAAIELANLLKREVLHDKHACHVVIAHSHGGNVALWALGQLPDDVRSQVAGLATLATPFLSFLPRRLSETETGYLKAIRGGWLSRFALWSSLAIIPFVLFANSSEISVLEKIFLVPCLFVGTVMLWRFIRRQTDVLRWLEENPARRPPALVNFLALRAPADEAGRMMALSDASARAVGAFWIINTLGLAGSPTQDCAKDSAVGRTAIPSVCNRFRADAL
jgi:pimeloyl-ACP methyl ester carboxylesterase